MKNESGRKILGKAEMAREEGDFIKALNYVNEAMVKCSQENDFLGFSEVLTSCFLTLRHLSEEYGDQNFMIIAKHYAMAGVEIAETSGDPKALAIPFARLAQANATLNNWSEAVELFRKAISNMKEHAPEYHDRPAVVADMLSQLSQAEYMAGDKSAKDRLDQAINELNNSEEIRYNKDVWLSGAYMRGAEMLWEEDPESSKKYLREAKKIIDANPELKLRSVQLQKLSERLGA